MGIRKKLKKRFASELHLLNDDYTILENVYHIIDAVYDEKKAKEKEEHRAESRKAPEPIFSSELVYNLVYKALEEQRAKLNCLYVINYSDKSTLYYPYIGDLTKKEVVMLPYYQDVIKERSKFKSHISKYQMVLDLNLWKEVPFEVYDGLLQKQLIHDGNSKILHDWTPSQNVNYLHYFVTTEFYQSYINQ